MAFDKEIQSVVLSPEVMEIRSRIYIVRGVPVMFDFDLARYYGIETRVLKQAVRRNMDSFPEDFMFEPTTEELNSLILNMGSQIVTPKTKTPFGGYTPFAFTEAGVAMLSAILKSSVAVGTRVQVMRGFVAMHQYLTQNGQLMLQSSQNSNAAATPPSLILWVMRLSKNEIRRNKITHSNTFCFRFSV